MSQTRKCLSRYIASSSFLWRNILFPHVKGKSGAVPKMLAVHLIPLLLASYPRELCNPEVDTMWVYHLVWHVLSFSIFLTTLYELLIEWPRSHSHLSPFAI